MYEYKTEWNQRLAERYVFMLFWSGGAKGMDALILFPKQQPFLQIAVDFNLL